MEETINIDFIFPNTGFCLSDVDLFFRRAMGMEGAVHFVHRSMVTTSLSILTHRARRSIVPI